MKGWMTRLRKKDWIAATAGKLEPSDQEAGIRYLKGLCVKAGIGAGIFFLLLGILILKSGSSRPSYVRPPAGEGNTTADLKAEFCGQDDNYTEEIDFTLPEVEYGEAAASRCFAEAKDYLAQHACGSNPNWQEIRTDLDLMTEIPDSPVRISWSIGERNADREGPAGGTAAENGQNTVSETVNTVGVENTADVENTAEVREEDCELQASDILTRDGSVHTENLTEAVLIPLTAKLEYRTYSETLGFSANILPPRKTKGEILADAWRAQLGAAWQSDSAEVTLPAEVLGYQVKYENPAKSPLAYLIPSVVLAAAAAAGGILSQIREKEKKRKQELMRQYPEIMESFVLMISAGLTIPAAWERTARKNDGCVYREMRYTLSEVQNGMSLTTAIGAFEKRVSLPAYQKMCFLLIQNLKRGTADLAAVLEEERIQAERERREQIMKQGEEAGTKLLLPMGIMLLVVIAILMVPAFEIL